MSKGKMDNFFVEELRGKLPEYLRMTGRAAAIRAKICCIDPNHSDSTPSMGYDSRRGRLHCFGCGKSFDLFDVIALDEPQCRSFPLQVRKACEVLGLSMPDDVPVGRSIVAPKAVVRKDLNLFVESCIDKSGVGGEYFEQRGISRELCEKYRLFMWEGCAYLPIYRDEKCVAYCARRLDEMEPRYFNSSGVMDVFGGDVLRKSGGSDIVVAESIFDALSAEMCGFSAVALCGVGNTRRFLELCKRCSDIGARRFILAGDNDEAGERMNAELAKAISALGAQVCKVVLPEGTKDLNCALLQGCGVLEGALSRSVEEVTVESGVRLCEAVRAVRGDVMYKPVSTGMPGVDALLDGGLYPGLYVLGAVSSLGKTSFLLQIADGIAQQGRDVLYFTLEMSGTELVAKSLSRISAQMDGTAGKMQSLSVREILRGGGGVMLDKVAEKYVSVVGKHVFFTEDAVELPAIAKTVKNHRKRRGVSPVVVVDYLQILQPADSRGTDKQNTDKAVVGLKRLSREENVPVVVISSFNRENYRSPVSMEAFKESGAVEYSSDVLMGLQMTGVGGAKFDLNLAKARSPRDVELVLLKNRSGKSYGVLPLRYYAKNSLFLEK